MLSESLQYANSHRDAFLTELKEFLSLPSVSALPEHQRDVQRTARWLAGQFSRQRGRSR